VVKIKYINMGVKLIKIRKGEIIECIEYREYTSSDII